MDEWLERNQLRIRVAVLSGILSVPQVAEALTDRDAAWAHRFRQQINLIPRVMLALAVADQLTAAFVDAPESVRRMLRARAESILREHFDEYVEELLYLAERTRGQ
jgi:hypothetical protein